MPPPQLRSGAVFEGGLVSDTRVRGLLEAGRVPAPCLLPEGEEALKASVKWGRAAALLIATALVCAFAMALPAVSNAGDEAPPPPEKPKPCGDWKFVSHSCDKDGDKIVVVEEPAGENCPNGGIKIIVFKDDHDYD